MICDVAKINKFKYYKSKRGPFVITFFHEDMDGSNFELYAFLKSIEKAYNDVPLLRFDYITFKKTYPAENVPSSSHLMVIQKNERTEFFETNDKLNIPVLLHSVREKIISRKRIKNKEFQFNNKSRMRPWIVNASKYRNKYIQEYVNMTAEMQYKFPNNTSIASNNISTYYQRKKLQKNRIILTLEESTSLKKPKTIKYNSMDKVICNSTNEVVKNFFKSDNLVNLTSHNHKKDYIKLNLLRKNNTDYCIEKTKMNILSSTDRSRKLSYQNLKFINAHINVSLSLENDKNILKSSEYIFNENKTKNDYSSEYKLTKNLCSNLNDRKYNISINIDNKNENFYNLLSEHSYCLPFPLDLSKKKISN